MTRGFSPLGRETFATDVELTFADDFAGAALGPEWIGVRRFPTEVAVLASGGLTIRGEDPGRRVAGDDPGGG
jgi:hypothetical protein